MALDGDGTLTFDNAAVSAGVAEPPAGGYVIEWSRFDNDTGEPGAALGKSTAAENGRSQAPVALPTRRRLLHQAGDPRRAAGEQRLGEPRSTPTSGARRGWRLVGLERMP